MRGLAVLAAVAANLAAVGLCSTAAGSQWHRLQWRCLDASLAVLRATAASDVDCVTQAEPTGSGEIVAQWNSDTGACCVYRYQQVCRLAGGAAGQCDTFGRLGVKTWPPNSKLVGVWLAGGLNGFENLVCSSGDAARNRFHPHSITWGQDGAIFNGANSYMWLNDTEFMSFSNGFTWLLRLKRQPKPQALLESVTCGNPSAVHGHLWEFDAINELYYHSYTTGFGPFGSSASVPVLPNDASAWINVGIVGSGSGNSLQLFYGSGLLAASQAVTSYYASGTPLPRVCLLLGRRWDDPSNRLLQGTVAAVGIANASMTQAEILDFFAQLP